MKTDIQRMKNGIWSNARHPVIWSNARFLCKMGFSLMQEAALDQFRAKNGSPWNTDKYR
jgi:hypothetical protein